MKKLEDILKLKPNPQNNNWDLLQQELNIVFPLDYKNFIDCYGCGAINDFLWILSPFAINENLNSKQLFQDMKYYDKLAQENGDYNSPFHFYDGKNGLFPFAISDNGDEVFFCFKDGGLNINVYESREMEPVVFDGGFLDFITEALTNDKYKDLFVEDFFGGEYSYISEENYETKE